MKGSIDFLTGAVMSRGEMTPFLLDLYKRLEHVDSIELTKEETEQVIEDLKPQWRFHRTAIERPHLLWRDKPVYLAPGYTEI